VRRPKQVARPVEGQRLPRMHLSPAIMKLPENHLKPGAVFPFDLRSHRGNVVLAAGTPIPDMRTVNRLLLVGPWVLEQNYRFWVYSQRKEYWSR